MVAPVKNKSLLSGDPTKKTSGGFSVIFGTLDPRA